MPPMINIVKLNNKIHRPNVFVVGRKKPTLPAGGRVVVVVMGMIVVI